jgi:hypothetical protein
MRHPLVVAAVAASLASSFPVAAFAAPTAASFAVAALAAGPDTDLLAAAFKGDVDGVSKALAAGANVNARLPGEDPSDEEAKAFGVDPDDSGASMALTRASEGHDTALLAAIERGKGDVVKLLISKGANLNAQGGSEKDTPLMLAIKRDQKAIAQDLVDAGANVSVRGGSEGEISALSLAMEWNMPELTRAILAKGAKSSGESVKSMPVVGYALGMKWFDIAETLIDRGGDVKDAGVREKAVEAGNVALVKKMVAKGAKFTQEDLKAAQDKYNDELVAYLKTVVK